MKLAACCFSLAAFSLTACQPPAFPMREAPRSMAVRAGDGQLEAAADECSDWRYAQLEHPIDPLLGNPVPAARLGLGCSLSVDLQQMIVDPGDLRGSGTTGPAGSLDASRAVKRYNSNEVTPLPDPSLHTLSAGS